MCGLPVADWIQLHGCEHGHQIYQKNWQIHFCNQRALVAIVWLSDVYADKHTFKASEGRVLASKCALFLLVNVLIEGSICSSGFIRIIKKNT
jgi:hypothetical protein